MINYNEQDKTPQTVSIEHIYDILNDVKTKELPVSDALDSLAYWYHEAFQKGDIQVEQPTIGSIPPNNGDLPASEKIWT